MEELPGIGMIYGLISPVSFRVRYIGQSTRNLQVRLNEHYSHSMNNRYASGPECSWVQALDEEGLRPGIVCLEVAPVELLDEKERWWIQFGLSIGWNLLNEDAGGAGRLRLVKTAQ